MFYNFVYPYEDEYLYSWYYRLAEINAYSMGYLLGELFGDNNRNYYFCDFSAFYNLLPEEYRRDNDIAELFGKLYIFDLHGMFMQREAQTRCACTFGASHGFIPMNEKFVDSLKVCPECLAEEMSGDWLQAPYLHRSHQVYGVSVCHKHGCTLMDIALSKSGYRSFRWIDIYDESCFSPTKQLLPPTEAYVYAVAVYKLLDLRIDADGRMVRGLIDRKLKADGYSKGIGDSSFLSGLRSSPYGPLVKRVRAFYKGKVNVVFSRFSLAASIVTVLYAYKGDIDSFISDLKDAADAQSDYVVPEGLELQKRSGVLNSYKCKTCGNVFMQTGWGIEHGVGCPECDSKNPKLFAERILKPALGDDYELRSKVKSPVLPVKILHRECGNTIEVTPSDFVFRRDICYCDWIISRKEAERRVNRVPGFRLKSYSKEGNIAVITHVDGCGEDFEINLKSFCDFPKCRACETRTNSANSKDKIRDLVGDEYELLSDYTGSRKPIRFRHVLCGNTFETSFGNFIRGHRCPRCTAKMDMNELAYALEQYTSGHYVARGCHKRSYLIIENTQDRGTFMMEYRTVRQEIFRPTPSDKIVLTAEEDKKRIGMLREGREVSSFEERFRRLDRYLRSRFGPDDVIFVDELDDLDEDRVDDIMSGGRKGRAYPTEHINCNLNYTMLRMVRKGYLRRIYMEVYVFVENRKEYTPEDLFMERYVCHNGKVVGRILYPEETGLSKPRCESTMINDKEKWIMRGPNGFRLMSRGI